MFENCTSLWPKSRAETSYETIAGSSDPIEGFAHDTFSSWYNAKSENELDF